MFIHSYNKCVLYVCNSQQDNFLYIVQGHGDSHSWFECIVDRKVNWGYIPRHTHAHTHIHTHTRMCTHTHAHTHTHTHTHTTMRVASRALSEECHVCAGHSHTAK